MEKKGEKPIEEQKRRRDDDIQRQKEDLTKKGDVGKQDKGRTNYPR